jgi:peptide/nickel transport system permease protein
MKTVPRAFHPLHRASFYLLAAILVVAVLGALYTPHDPLALSVDNRFAAPSADHPMGTDHFGRDVLSRVMVGLGVSIRISLFAIALALALGLFFGAVAGYFGGLADRIISTVTDAFLAMPGILMALALVAVFGGSSTTLVIALGFAYTPNVTRVIRGTALSLRERTFVAAAKLMGRSDAAVLWRHILPNTLGAVTVLGSSFFAQAFLSESALSFLGLGVPPPYPSLGGILAESRRFMDMAPWLALAPGGVIMLTLLSVNLIGDALRDRFDPRNTAE